MCPLYGGQLWLNVHAGLEKVFALWNACFRASALEKFCYVGFLRN